MTDPMAELAASILNRPILFDKAWLDALLAIRSDNVDAESFFDFLFADKKPTGYTNRDGVAVIDVSGPLMKQSRFMASYEAIGAQVRQAMADESVRSLLLNIDSGGGVVNGAFELSKEIFDSRREKPIHAIANDDAYSAAFAIGSAATHFTVTQTGGVGSVGVIATHVEYSKEESAMGWAYTTIFSGARKNDFSTHEPLSKTAKSDLQEHVDDLRGMFAQRVSANRGISFESVIGTEAAVYRGEAALAVGFADAIGDFGAALETASEAGGVDGSSVAVAASIRKVEESRMDPNTVETTATEETEVAEVVDIESVRTLAVQHQKARNREVIDLCEIAGSPNLALGFIREGTSVKDVRKQLLESRASESSEEIISSEPENATQHEHDSKALVNEMTRRLNAAGITPEVR